MTTIQSQSHWMPRKLIAVALTAACTLLGTTAAQASTNNARASQTARSATTTRAAAARTLASRIHTLRACERVHPRHCAAARRAVKRAAHNLAATEARPASFAGSTRYALTAPAITVSGDTLRWKAIGRTNTYVVSSKTPGQAVRTSVVPGTATTPPVVPGATVSYSVRTTASNSQWSSEVAISYPAAASSPPAGGKAPAKESPITTKESPAPTKESPAPTKEAPTPTKESPAPVGESPVKASPAPTEEPPTQSSTAFQPGLNSGTNMNEDLQGAVILGAKVVRVAWAIGTTAAAMEPVIAGYASKGIRVEPLAEFYQTLPTPAEAQNLASWARAYGPGGTFWAGRSDGQLAIKAIEFGNETASEGQYHDRPGEASFYARAQGYALRFREAAEATTATGTGVGLLAQDEDQSGEWMNGMYSAVPTLSKYVAGWTIHPYGGEQYNRERLDALIAQTAEHGASNIPVDITEWGVATDNGNCLNFNEGFNVCMSYEEAAQTLRNTVTWVSKLLGNRLGDFFIYQVRDQRTTGTATNCQDYYGALQHELQPKGAYTTQIQALLSSSAP
jgi:hypothetical protein